MTDTIPEAGDGSMTALFFGARWDTPRLDGAQEIPTPVGEPCLMCTETIGMGDRGFLTAVITGERDSVAAYVHAECEMDGILGHTVGVCSCTGWEPGRKRARAVWRKVASLNSSLEPGGRR